MQRTSIVPEWGIRPGKNTSGSSIAAKRIVKLTAEQEIAVGAASTDNLFGVTEYAIANGATGDIQIAGKAVVTSGAAISVGQKLTTDATGRATPATISAGTTVGLIGTAASATSGADQDVEVELMPQGVGFTGSQSVADRTALKAVAAANRWAGLLVLVRSDGSLWRFDAASSASDTTENLVCTPDAGTGRWLRADKKVDLKLAISFATADAAVLFTVPAGFRLRLDQVFWEVTADWTGGTASAVGASSSQAPHDGKGDLLGGATGDVAATLTAANGITQGTVGTSFSAAPKMAVLEAASTVRFDRITSAFTAGTGFVHVSAQLIG